jgi:DNA modification methylase
MRTWEPDLNQLTLPFYAPSPANGDYKDRNRNRLTEQDKAVHDWYRFVLSYPAHLVRDYLQDFSLTEQSVVLDPFCGTGTTVVECKLNRIQAIGVEANPFAHFAGQVKLDWAADATGLRSFAEAVAEQTFTTLLAHGLDDNRMFSGELSNLPLKQLAPDAEKMLIKNSISPLPLHKVLVLFEILQQHQQSPYYAHALLALAKSLVFHTSNVRFGPEISVGKLKLDVPVIQPWLMEVTQMANDLEMLSDRSFPRCHIHHADARNAASLIKPSSVDAIITSPPYPNEKDYTRATRLESVVLGFISNYAELRTFKKGLLRSNTRGVYKEDTDDHWIHNNQRINELADQIERRRIELNKTSGFEKLYGKVTKLYFGGMARHLQEMKKVLRPGAQLAYVVGDQASFLRIMIRTGKLLAEIAEDLGYEVIRIDLFRTRAATATREELREEVVVLKWQG